MPSKSKIVTEGDPLARVMAPPPNETEEQREARVAAEAEAKKISDAIDEELQRQAKAEKRGPKPVKILLLGQSESGKSTTLKNFQLMNTPKAFRAERASWRAVVHLNVVRSIRVIVEAMSETQAYHASTYSSPNTPVRTHAPDLFRSPSGSSLSRDARFQHPPLTAEHLKLKLRLSPLVQVEETLIRKLTPAGSGEMEATQLLCMSSGGSHAERVRALDRELAVNSQFAWKGVFHKMIGRTSQDGEADAGDPDDPSLVLHACAEDMITLWDDPVIKALLRAQGIRLEDMPGFFLDCIERVTHPKYVPTDDDILRARLKTLGVSEHRFTIKEVFAGGISRDLRIYDVGGHRSLVRLRAAWAPFFDDMNAILFLAPLSGFDQVLAEDESVNRLEDSVLLWKSICSNPLLGKTNLILFLNKIDIFKAKLRAGIQFGQYIISYGNRPNDYDNTSAYMRRKFGQIHREYSPQARTFYCHFTSVTDTKSTSEVLVNIQESIIHANLKSISLTG
ncbi:G-alpha-domain-containing protein [Trametes maxima]|nr:G-alpha-domain-containing protein [Trametes maxima]